MAFLTLEDVYGSVECVAFPAIYERSKATIAVDKIVSIKGKLDLSKPDEPTIILDTVKEFDRDGFDSANAKANTVKQRRATLWLNASELSDEDFDEIVGVLTNYEGETLCAIVRGNKKYRLPSGINYCRGLIAELRGYLYEKDIKFVE